MLFALILRTESDEIVQFNASKYATENGTFFALDKPAYDKVCEIAAAFEESITSEYEKQLKLKKITHPVVRMIQKKKLKTIKKLMLKGGNEGQGEIDTI